MPRLFGTDGVRGIAGEELTCELAFLIGMAGARVLTSDVHRPVILIGMDARMSGPMLSAAMTAGICAVGGDVINVGVLPTPALAYLVKELNADAAVVISASHNPYQYNGIKWFDSEGYKLSDALEDEIEALVSKNCADVARAVNDRIGGHRLAQNATDEYIKKLLTNSSGPLDGIKAVVDCANGAASHIAPNVLRQLGVEVHEFACAPDGRNINAACGSTKPAKLCELVKELGADVGLAFDGDADRMLAVDEQGQVVDGDRIMSVLAKDLKDAGRLNSNTLVTTVMSNKGMHISLAKQGIHTQITDVGDRYVLECMRGGGFNLGGEQSGHITFLDYATTGDGILSAIQLLGVMAKNKAPFSELCGWVEIFPQVLINVEVENGQKTAALQNDRVLTLIKDAQDALGNRGRVLVRSSGTEPLIRVMLEGEDVEFIESEGSKIAKTIKTVAESKEKERHYT